MYYAKRLSLIAIITIAVIYFYNFYTLMQPMNEVINNDKRNTGIEYSVHYKYYISTSDVIVDLTQIASTNSPMDVFRVLLQYAHIMSDKTFNNIYLSHQGKVKFILKGDYFKRMGLEYESQNPMYTMRTFPENLYLPDGKNAFSKWSGGLFAVLKNQMNDFNKFHQQWYMGDLINHQFESKPTSSSQEEWSIDSKKF